MNFFAHQDRARRQTRRMLVMFGVAVVAIVLLVDAIVLGAIARGANAIAFTFVSLLVLGTIASGSLYRIATLRAGGVAVAAQLGATAVPHDGGDFACRRLRNVVEELAIASGVPMPQVFLLEDEAGINAFAAGYAPADAAIVVTRGALDKLTRDELQGVIGHEFSHVLNGDMRLNIRLVGVVFGILVVSIVGRKLVENVRGRNSGYIIAVGALLMGAGYLGSVFGRMIKASISRQREFLADASAVQFTRQTEGIAGALKKIGALAGGSRLALDGREEVAHMLFGDGVGYGDLFATHPPVRERIRRLDPSFRESELATIAAAWAQPELLGEDARDLPGVSVAGFAPATAVAVRARAGERVALPGAGAPLHIAPSAVVAQVGNPGNDDRAAARTLRRTIPPPLRDAARQPGRAMPLVFALVLGDDDTGERQLELVATQFDAGTAALARELHALVAELHPMLRLPLAALAFPVLRRRPRAQLHAFVATLRALVEVDGEVTLGEYCLARLVDVQVVDALDPARAGIAGRLKLPAVEAELKVLLAIIARHGHADAAQAQRAYALGLAEVLPHATIAYRPPPDWAAALDHVLPVLDRLAPAGKALVVAALVRAIGVDGVVSVEEAELLRTVCGTLHCPLPPLLQLAD